MIVGVISQDFRFPTATPPGRTVLSGETQPDIIRLAQANSWLKVIGRLSGTNTPAAASAELQGMFTQEASGYFSSSLVQRTSVVAAPLQDRLVGDTRQRLLVLMGAVGCVLLIVCANVANLLLARLSTRQAEYAVRAVLGARPGRLARLVLTESLLLAASGAVAALLLAYWTGGVTRSMIAERVPHVGAVPIDWWVLAFNAVLAAIVGLLSGLASIMAVRSAGFAGTFNDGGGRSITSRMRLRRTLLAAEVAVTFLLVVTAALLSQTLWNLYHSNRGFDGSRVITAAVERPNMAGTIRELQPLLSDFFSHVTEQISSLPGVRSAAAASDVPLVGVAMGMSGVSVVGQAPSSAEGAAVVGRGRYPGLLRDDWHAAAGRPRLRSQRCHRRRTCGHRQRNASAADRAEAGARGRADQLWPVSTDRDRDRGRHAGHVAAPAGASVRLPPDGTNRLGSSYAFGRLTIVARTRAPNPAALVPAIRRAVWALGHDIVIDDVATMNERVAASVRTERDSALLFGLLAGIALVVAVAGVYGVVAYSVVQRTREIGVRIALGAGHRQVVGDVVRASAWPVAVGIAIGVCGAAVATRAVASVLFETQPTNPAIFAATALVLAVTALAAAWIPARRAALIDPVTALRAE